MFVGGDEEVIAELFSESKDISLFMTQARETLPTETVADPDRKGICTSGGEGIAKSCGKVFHAKTNQQEWIGQNCEFRPLSRFDFLEVLPSQRKILVLVFPIHK